MTDVIIGGWIAGQGWRAGLAGSLLAGISGPGGLHYVGQVGSGFTELELRHLTTLLHSLSTPTPPFTGAVPTGLARHAHWVHPVLRAEVAYTELTATGRLRQPVWRGLRPT